MLVDKLILIALSLTFLVILQSAHPNTAHACNNIATLLTLRYATTLFLSPGLSF